MALKAFSLNELGVIRELVTGCRVLEDCFGCCVSELGQQWKDCLGMLRTVEGVRLLRDGWGQWRLMIVLGPCW